MYKRQNLNNDVIVEPSETFTITLSGPTAGLSLGPNVTHTFTIQDDDNSRKIYFDLAISTFNENAGTGTIAVSINNIDAVNPTTVNYAVSSGTATGSGTDYTLAAGTLTIPASSTTNNISFTLNDDGLFEGDETFTVTLSSPTNTNLDGVMPFGGTGFISHEVTITDNDVAPEVQFISTSTVVSETAITLSIPIELNTASGIDAIVNYTLTGTATNGSDYTLSDGTATVLAGNTTTNISLPIINDIIEELTETVILTLSAPTNATLGTNTVYTITINDDDLMGCDGPGGVGDASNNVLWVKADDIPVVADGNDVLSWLDQSGNSHNLTQSNSSFSPTYQSSVINSQPVVRFSKSNARIIHNSFSAFPTTEISTFLVNSNSDSGDGVYSYATTASNNEFLLFNSSNLTLYRQGVNLGSGTSINGGTFRIINATWRSSDGNYKLYRNGTENFSGTIATGTSIVTGGCLAIAGEQDAVDGGYSAGQAHQGDFAEVITYNLVLNSARRKIVNNYLSAKYNLTIVNDLYSYDAPGTHGFEVAGLGRDDINNFHLAGKGSAIVKIKNATDLDDGEFLIWGHDNANPDFNDTDVPLTVDNRVNRVWRVDETGSVGDVDLVFDMSDFTVTDGTQLVLLIDSDDGAFTNASIIPITSYGGSEATFEGVSLNSGNWFTVATLSPTNTLPITLLSFDAELVNESVELVWETAAEINNDYFTIERSEDAQNWDELFMINGAGNSSSPKKYAAIDSDVPTGGNYYRLRQTDFDGKSEVFKPVYVVYQKPNKNTLSVYPNPTDGLLTLNINNALLSPIRVFNSTGKIVSDKVEISQSSEFTFTLDVSSLKNGIYFIKLGDQFKKVIKR